MKTVVASVMGAVGLGFGTTLADVSAGGAQRAVIAVCTAITATSATVLAVRMNSYRTIRSDAVELEKSVKRRDDAIKERDRLIAEEREHNKAAGLKIEELQKAVAALQERTDLAPVVSFMREHETAATKRAVATQEVLERIADGMSATNLNLQRLVQRQEHADRPEA